MRVSLRCKNSGWRNYGVLRQQIRRHVAWRVEPRSIRVRPHKGASPELHRREHLRCACAADAWNAPQIRGAESGQAVQPAAPAEHDVRQLQDILRS